MLGCNILFVDFVNATLNDGQLFVEIELLKRERERSGSTFETLRFIKKKKKNERFYFLIIYWVEEQREIICEYLIYSIHGLIKKNIKYDSFWKFMHR